MVDLVRRQEFEIRGFPISHLKEPLILPLFRKKKSVSIRQQAILFQHFHRGWNDPLPLSKVIRRLETGATPESAVMYGRSIMISPLSSDDRRMATV